ncbi:MAG: hypothetical protein EOP19_33260, partial [Hyphomicrobiales bacterium]
MLQIELGRMLHQIETDGIGVTLAKDGIDHVDGAVGDVAAKDQHELGGDQRGQRVEPAARPPVGEIRPRRWQGRLMGHLVEDELGDQQQQRRQHRHEDAQHDAERHQQRARLPHLGEEAAEVADGLEALALL